MAATAFEFFHQFKYKLGTGAIDLSGVGDSFSLVLCSSASNVAATLSTYGSLTGELATDNGYTAGGRALTVNFSAKATASVFSFTFNTVVWTAPAGSALTNVKFAVIRTNTSSLLVCWSQLSTAEITVPAGNEFHVYPNTVAFELH